jgi:hypothetical protein
MKSFSEIDITKTPRDRIIENFISQTGLPQDTVERLYESNRIETILKGLNEDMSPDLVDMLNRNMSHSTRSRLRNPSTYSEKRREIKRDPASNLSSIFNGISINKDANTVKYKHAGNYLVGSDPLIGVEYDRALAEPNKSFGDYAIIIAGILQDFEISEATKMISKLLYGVKDVVKFIKLICYICFLKNKEKFTEANPALAEEFYPEIFNSLNNVSESCSKLYRVNNIDDGSKVPSQLNFAAAMTDDIGLYSTLKDVLSRNNKSWGSNYHLDNVYDSIWSYLDSEIEYLVNKNNVTEINDSFHQQFIIDLIFHKINPMYRQVDVLKALVPDIQTLVFDLIVLVTEFCKTHQTELSYLNRDIWDEYTMSTTNILKSIFSSRLNSKLLAKEEVRKACCTAELEGPKLEENFLNSSDFNIPYNVIGNARLKTENMIDCIYTVKSCQNEFNLHIRKLLNVWITKAIEIISRGDRIITERNRINKYKG